MYVAKEYKQIQIDDELYLNIVKFLSTHNLTVEQFAEKLHTSSYMLNKAIDRKIMMHIPETLLAKIIFEVAN